ncbi:MAG: carboxypeptidase-like regulatory domain-containing protein [Pyrinomonadaceae bacterium]
MLRWHEHRGLRSECNGRIVGVQDTTGALVPGTTVIATNPETAVSYKTISSDNILEALPPDTYTITVEQTNFKKYSTSQNIVTANDTVTINVPLEPGDISETVTVMGGEASRGCRCEANQRCNIRAQHFDGERSAHCASGNQV